MTKSSKKKIKPTAKSKTMKPVQRRRTTSSMDTSEIRDFISFIAQSGLNEVKIETAKLKLHIKRSTDQDASYTNTSPLPVPRPTSFLPAKKQEDTVPEKNTSERESTSTVEIKSPMVGTFYRSANPTTDPFVSVGDKIKKGQIVCIIEAMKLFNEIESEISGTVTKIIAENSSPVEYEQPLFLVEID